MGEKNKDREEQKLEKAFNELAGEGGNSIEVQRLVELLEKKGISKEDPRIKKSLGSYPNGEGEMSREDFKGMLQSPEAEVIKKAFNDGLAIPDFEDFEKDIREIFDLTKGNEDGEMLEMLPHPAMDRQPAFAVSICTVDGQLLQLGDHDLDFSLQSISKAISYAIAVEEVGKEKVHEHVGSEPGDESFESGRVLNENGLPHNPMLTSGSIMACSLIKPNMEVDERLEYVKKIWGDLTGDKQVEYKNETFETEINKSHKHYALSHLMKLRGAFPEGADLDATIAFYLKCNALSVNVDDLAHAAASLANFGKCPSTGKNIFKHDTVRDTLSLMLTCGLYGHSAKFAFRVGLPAKSGVSGGIMVVIPELLGISIYSPPLGEHSNSVRGVEFCERLVDKFNFHIYDALRSDIHGRKDPRNKRFGL